MDNAKKQNYQRLLRQILPIFIVIAISYVQAIEYGIRRYADNCLFIGMIIGLIYGIYKVKKDRKLTVSAMVNSRGIRLSIILLFLTITFFIYYNINFFSFYDIF